MATKKVATRTPTGRKSAASYKLEIQKLNDQLNKFRDGSFCYMCGEVKSIDHFYVDYDPNVTNNKKGISSCVRVCKQCFQALIHGTIHGGAKQPVTKNSLKKGLYYLNKPFISDVYDSAVEASKNEATRGSTDIGQIYITQINSLPQYKGMTWLDSSMFQVVNGGHALVDDDDEQQISEQELIEGHMGEDVYDNFVRNRNDVQRLLGYDPFEEESINDQPFLYSQLLGLLDQDEGRNDDMLRVSSAITIVRGFLQQAKIDDAITKLMGSTEDVSSNSATIKSLQDSKQKITSMITQLAAESCLSLKNSKAQTKGENSFTGKLKRLKDLNLREAELNGFSEETCKGMQQVANISMNAIVNKLSMDESEWADMVKQQRQMVVEAQSKADGYEEAFRLLLRENLDLRKTLQDNNELPEDNLLDLNEVIGTYIEKKDQE